jgi:enoyl-CoA hydratase/carnithine racemase
MTYEHILVEHDAAVTRVTMNRPARRNALSEAHMGELIDAFRSAGARPETRAVILAGNGPAFCAGHDLRELLDRDVAAYRRVFDRCVELMTAIQSISQPVIAQVHGIATAAGCQLAATCDLVVASSDARFATPGVNIGLFCTTPMVALTRAIGRKRAMEMLLTGEPIDATTAADWGLVNRIAPAAELAAAARTLADTIAASSALVVAIGKQAFYTQIDLDQRSAYAYAKEVMSKNALAADAQEGMCAFVEKRAARWTGR